MKEGRKKERELGDQNGIKCKCKDTVQTEFSDGLLDEVKMFVSVAMGLL